MVSAGDYAHIQSCHVKRPSEWYCESAEKLKCRPIQVSMQYRMHNTQNHGLIDIYSKECSMFNAQRSMANAPKKTTAPKQHWRKRIEIVIWLVINMHTMCLGSLRSAKKPVINANKIHWTHKVTLQTSCATFAIFHFIFLQSFFLLPTFRCCRLFVNHARERIVVSLTLAYWCNSGDVIKKSVFNCITYIAY